MMFKILWFIAGIMLVLNAAANQRYILYLNSYHAGYPWSDAITNGITEGAEKLQNTTLFIEYMDTKRFPDSAVIENLREKYSLKFDRLNFDLIICSDDFAYNFLKQYKDSLFGDCPVVFTGVENPKGGYLDSSQYYGIKEINAPFENALLAEKFQPDLKKIVFIQDSMSISEFQKKEIIHYFGDTDYEIEFYRIESLGKLKKKVSQLDRDQAIITTPVHKTAGGVFVDYIPVVKQVVENTNALVYNGDSLLMGTGIIGGAYINSYDLGRRTIGISEKLLSGDSSQMANILHLDTEAPRYLFDKAVLKKYTIPDELLPEARLFNQPKSFFESHQNSLFLIIALLVLVISLALFIAILFRFDRKLKKQNYHLNRQKNALMLINKDLKAAKEKSEESDRLKSAFLSNMSHEIRTPMNAIIGFSNLLTENLVPFEKRDIYLKQIQSNGKILLSLIEDIIDVSKIESGQLTIRHESFRINPLLENVNENFQAMIETMNKKVELKLDKSNFYHDYQIKSDSFRINQIFNNLITNAIKFTEEGYIKFGYRLYESLNENKIKVLFYVKDTGIGIREENHKYIFGRFMKFEAGDKLLGGTGLGLSICRKLTEMMGGRTWFESRVGEGLMIYFTVTCELDEVADKGFINHQKLISETPLNGMSICYLDKSRENMELLFDILGDKGIDLLWFTQGQEMLEYLRAEKSQMCICNEFISGDLSLNEIFKEVEKINPEIIKVFYSNNASPNNSEVNEKYVDKYLPKPFKANDIYYLIGEFISEAYK